MIKLGVNIDHVATLRQARREIFPDPMAAALEAVRGGADGITAHLREDRRHIQDADMIRLRKNLPVPLNMEMALAPDILKTALRIQPAWVCVVPERRQELTTEGGLNVRAGRSRLKPAIQKLHDVGVRVSLFIDAAREPVLLAAEVGADAIEIHTGSYARGFLRSNAAGRLKKIGRAARLASQSGLLVNAGHGLDARNVRALGRAHRFNEFNIGFAIVARAVFVGLREAVREMKKAMNP